TGAATTSFYTLSLHDALPIYLGDAAFLRPDRRGEVAEVVDGQREVRGQGFADALAVVPGLGDGEHLEVGFDAVGDLEQDVRPLRRRGPAPGRCRSPGRVEGGLDILGGGAGDLGEDLTGHGSDVLEVVAVLRRHPLAADEV